jgi:hypothetical protein
MNLRRKMPPDSLYLLLDTLCNAFGGIILLAVLVVLLTSKEKTQSSKAADSQEMLQRRLAIAQTDLQKSQQLAASLQAKANDERLKQQVELLSTRKALQEAIRQSRETVAQYSKDLDTASAVDPSERLKFLNAQLAAAEAHKLEARNSLAAADENTKRLKQRLADLERQVTTKLDELQRPLRLPKEHETGKRVIYVIVKYGHIYLCRNYDLSRNETDIDWTTTLTGETAEPRRGQGIDPTGSTAGLINFFKNMSDDSVYVAFCVYDDSFPAFIRAKQLASDCGLAYGWEPFQISDGPVSFGAVGHTPKPQ